MENYIAVAVLLCLTLGMVGCSACMSYVGSQYGITPTPLKMSSSDKDVEFVKVIRAPTSDLNYDTVTIYVKNYAARAKSCYVNTRTYTHRTDSPSRLSTENTYNFDDIGPGETKTVEFRLCSNYTTSTAHTWLGCEYEIGTLTCG
jgi:hypothetical protein